MSKEAPTRVLLPSTLVAIAKRVFFVFAILIVLTSVYSITRGNTQQALAATPATLNFQARLMASSGNLVPDGNYNIEFKLYNSNSSTGSSQGSCSGDANCLWTETRTGGNQVQVKNGYLSAYLGDVTALPSNIWDQQLWLTMNIGGTGLAVWDGEMTPRIRLTSVPYAFQAKSAETLNKNTGSFTGTVDFATMTADRRFLFPDTSLATTASPGTICVYNGAASNCPAASGSAYYLQNDTVLQTQTNFHIQARNSGASGTIGGVITGAANGQTVDLLQFRASDDTTVLAAVTAAGNLQVASSVDSRTSTTLSVGAANATAISIGKAGVTTTVNGALTVTEALTANGGATITGITSINGTGTATTTIGNANAGITLNGAVTANEAVTFNESVTVAAQQTIRLVGGTTAQRPLSPGEGTVYFDTDTKQLLVYANGKWQADRSTATKIVAASDSAPVVKDSADYVAPGTSDEDTINTALSAAAGGTVYLAAGTYTTDGTILIPNNTKLVGNGDQTLIQFNVGGGNGTAIRNQDTTSGSGVVIRDIRIDGSLGTGGTQHGIRFDGLGGLNSEITGVRLTGWTNGSALKLENTSGINTLSKSYIQGDITLTGNSGIALMTSNLVFANISLNSSSINNLTNNNIGGNVTLSAGSGTFSVAANLISGTFTVDGSVARNVTGNDLGKVVLNASDNVTLEANTIDLNSVNAIELTDSDNVRIVNNRIITTGGSGYSIDITDAASVNTYIAGNDLGGLAINDSGTGTVYGGQINASNNYVVQPAGTIELMKDTNVTGNLSVSGTTTTRGLIVNSAAATDDQILITVANGGAGRFNGTITNADLDAARTWTLPNASGTFITTGNLASITATGTVSSGVWQGTAIADAYINDNITISSAGSVDWTALNNYPAACSAGSAISQLGDTISCTSFATGSAASYIQNQNTGAQSTSNYWISGTGRADTSFLAPTFDIATAATLSIGTGNATLINIGKAGVTTNIKGALTVDQNLTVANTGNVAFQRNTTDYTATGTQDNVNFGTGALFRITSASAVTINGIAGGADGRIITLVNASANVVTLGNNASGTAANHIVTGAGGSLTVPAGSSVQLAYDSSSSVWRVIGGSATSGGSANQQLSNLSGTVAVNQSLVPRSDLDNLIDLGSSSYGWRSLYADTSVLTPLVGRATAGTLELGTDANSTAVTISRTGVLSTVAGSLQVNQGSELRGGLTVTSGGNVAIQRNTTDYAATGTQDNVNFGTGALFRITSASAVTINGIAGGADGRLLTLMNASSNNVTLGNSASGTAANHIVTGTGGALVVPAGSSVQLAYDSSSNVWRVIGGTAVAGGAANQQLSNLSGTIAANASLTPNGDNTLDLGSASFSWRTVYADTSVLTALLDASSAAALNIGTTNATQINLNKNTQVTGNVTLAEGANRMLSVQARSTAGVGYNLTVAAGAANGAGNAGGGLFLQGGAAVAGNANGGAVTIAGGAGFGTGTQGLVNLSTTAFSTSLIQSYVSAGVQGFNNPDNSIINNFSTIPVTSSTTGTIVSVPDPAQSAIGRIVYIAARSGSNDFTLRLNASRTPIDIAMKANSTATLIWNGTDWTAAGASSSTDLQSAYNNTLTSAGGAEIVLNPVGGAADGFTIRNNSTTPISGGILEVQSSIGTNLFSVNNFGTELAANGGAETQSTFATNWSVGTPSGATVSRSTTAGQYVTGQAGVSILTTSTALTGVRNNLSGNPVNTIGAQYQVSFTAKSTVNGTQVQVDYSRNGGTNMTTCSNYGTGTNYATLSDTKWTKVTCTITIDSATAATDPDLFIRKLGAASPTIYVDNLSFMRNDATTQPSNVQIGGGINGGPITLFTLDRSSAPPVADGNDTYLGSMYYDTTTGRIQCYEADGWGACGSPPDNIITLTPEYTGAVLNGNGIGVMTADFCGDGALNVNAAFCGTGEARNYYRWTSPQNTSQSYSIYVNYKLPSTFKEFADANTMKITTRSDDLSLARADLEVFRKAASGGISSCGAHTTLNDALSQWQQKTYSGNETTCGFQGGDYIIFKITVYSSQSKNIYIENIDFTYMND